MCQDMEHEVQIHLIRDDEDNNRDIADSSVFENIEAGEQC